MSQFVDGLAGNVRWHHDLTCFQFMLTIHCGYARKKVFLCGSVSRESFSQFCISFKCTVVHAQLYIAGLTCPLLIKDTPHGKMLQPFNFFCVSIKYD